MITRRGVIGAALAGVATAPALAAAHLSEDGLYQMDWYLESFLDLSDDLKAATAEGKRFAILWGLRNCPACRIMHQVYLADPAVEGFIRTHFSILHLNIPGAGRSRISRRIAADGESAGRPIRDHGNAGGSVLPRLGRDAGRAAATRAKSTGWRRCPSASSSWRSSGRFSRIAVEHRPPKRHANCHSV